MHCQPRIQRRVQLLLLWLRRCSRTPSKCGCCLNADGGPVDGPAAIHKWVAILPEVGGDSEIDALVELACDASGMVKNCKPGAVGALTLVNERLDALGVAD